MNPYWLERTELLIGEQAVPKLQNANILLVGLGGVGSFAAEFLGRAGIGKMTIVDGDVVDITNKNRQLVALDSTVGVPKAKIMSDRLLDINPALELTAIQEFISPERTVSLVEEGNFDFVIDCIDSLQPKINLIMAAIRTNKNIISSMGAGGKLNPERVQIADISKTKYCRFAHTVRKYLAKEGVKRGVTTVFSDEPAPEGSVRLTDGTNFKKSFYGTISYIPAVFGLYIASDVVRKIIAKEEEV